MGDFQNQIIEHKKKPHQMMRLLLIYEFAVVVDVGISNESSASLNACSPESPVVASVEAFVDDAAVLLSVVLAALVEVLLSAAVDDVPEVLSVAEVFVMPVVAVDDVLSTAVVEATVPLSTFVVEVVSLFVVVVVDAFLVVVVVFFLVVVTFLVVVSSVVLSSVVVSVGISKIQVVAGTV